MRKTTSKSFALCTTENFFDFIKQLIILWNKLPVCKWKNMVKMSYYSCWLCWYNYEASEKLFLPEYFMMFKSSRFWFDGEMMSTGGVINVNISVVLNVKVETICGDTHISVHLPLVTSLAQSICISSLYYGSFRGTNKRNSLRRPRLLNLLTHSHPSFSQPSYLTAILPLSLSRWKQTFFPQRCWLTKQPRDSCIRPRPLD